MNVHALLKKYDIHPKRKLGQNFLVAVPTLERIVESLNATDEDKVLEIGPGIGAMTKILTDHAKFVAAVETDKNMIRILENEWGNISNLHVIHGDILDTNLEKLIHGPIPKKTSDKWLFIGNIPYNITSPLLFHLKKSKELFSRGILLIQKEVADRLTAVPRTKEYGILSVVLQAVADIEKLFNVSPSSFYPEPKVDSTLIKITFPEKPKYTINDEKHFTSVVRGAFSTRRKKLKNALLQSSFLSIPGNDIAEAIEKTGISANARAEELDIATFIRLADNLKK